MRYTMPQPLFEQWETEKSSRKHLSKENMIFRLNQKGIRNLNYADYMIKKSKRIKGIHSNETSIEQKKSFDIVVQPLTKEKFKKISDRLLLCDDFAVFLLLFAPIEQLHIFYNTEINPVLSSHNRGNQINKEQTIVKSISHHTNNQHSRPLQRMW
jgi:hypothetical protein